MHMLGTVVSQIQQKVGIFKDLCIAKALELMKLCNNIIVAGIDHLTLIALYIKSLFVQLKLSIEHLVALFIIAVRSTKIGLMTVILNLGVRGHQALTIVRQIPQRVLSLLKQGH
jgi:hypothetical protein